MPKRIVMALGLVFLATWPEAYSADEANTPLRPAPRVLLDPPVYYSPLLFTPKAKPKPGEWMAEYPEPPQSFAQYTGAKPVRATRGRHTILMAPVGPMQAEDGARLTLLCEFLKVYYTLPVREGKPLGLDGVTCRDREYSVLKWRQYLTEDILYQVLRPALPDDALFLLGVTMDDLYPEPPWNYVFGQASLTHRVGIYSLVRFYPAFWKRPETKEAERLGLVRSLHTLVHETGHMFGVHHCQKYDCVMNGTNSLQESDTHPLHLCPECLRKFRWNIGFDVVGRYEALETFYRKHGMASDADWVAKRLGQCHGKKATP